MFYETPSLFPGILSLMRADPLLQQEGKTYSMVLGESTCGVKSCDPKDDPRSGINGCKKKKKKKKKSDITPDPGGHRPQRPCAQGRTCAEQE